MRTRRAGNRLFGNWNLAPLAASVACGLSGCYDGLESDGEWEPGFPGFEIPAESDRGGARDLLPVFGGKILLLHASRTPTASFRAACESSTDALSMGAQQRQQVLRFDQDLEGAGVGHLVQQLEQDLAGAAVGFAHARRISLVSDTVFQADRRRVADCGPRHPRHSLPSTRHVS